jgi:RNA polymerase sigma factor (sigma-70 family)
MPRRKRPFRPGRPAKRVHRWRAPEGPSDDPATRWHYVIVNEPLVILRTEQCWGRHARFSDLRFDLYQVGRMAVYDAVEKFDPAIAKWSTFASSYIYWHQVRWLQHDRVVRLPQWVVDAGRDTITHQVFDEFDVLDETGDPAAIVETLEERERAVAAVRAAVATLKPRQREVREQRHLDGEAMLREIGESLGVTRERVRQIEAKAIETLRALLA